MDAQWGEGKTTFIKLWRGHVDHHSEQPIKTIYYDAFRNDFQQDPFLTLTREIYNGLDQSSAEIKEKFLSLSLGVSKSIAKGGLKIGAHLLTGGLVNGTAIEEAKGAATSMLTNQVDELFKERITTLQADQKAHDDFAKMLEAMAKADGQGGPVVFIIDELDRCKPSFLE